LLVIFIARKSGSVTSTNLIIAGIIVGSILSSGISFLKSLSGEKVSAIIFWLLGSLSARGWNHVAVGFPFIIAGIIVCIYFSRDLNILSLGEKEARFLGVNPRRTYIVFFIAASMITAACVSISGIIGFVGLIVPHLLRFSLTSDNRVLLPLSALLGGVLLLMADTLSRVLLTVEIPVGVLTTLLGGPFFLYIFIKKNRGINPF
ncbi:MAG: iron ABC transporter permease, partial [Eubacteriales bacterium]